MTRVGTWLNPSHNTLTYLANFRQHARRLREVAKILGDYGLRLALEYVGPKTSWSGGRFPFIHTMAEMKELIAEIACDNVGFILDSWHWYTAHETRADILSLRAADVVWCHLNDAPKGIPVDQQIDNRRDLPAATGVIDLAGFLQSLARIGYDGPIVAEPFRPGPGRHASRSGIGDGGGVDEEGVCAGRLQRRVTAAFSWSPSRSRTVPVLKLPAVPRSLRTNGMGEPG